MSSKYRVAILIVSDTAARDASLDRTGPALRDLLHVTPNFDVHEFLIVPDEPEAIKSAIILWQQAPDVHLVITAGGTGFGTRDRTPETVMPLLDKSAPGLVHLILAAGTQSVGPLAGLSRPIAGTLQPGKDGKAAIIITFPGSPKAAAEGLNAVLPVLPHALDLAAGGSGKGVHDQMSNDQHVPHQSSTIDAASSLAPTGEHTIDSHRAHRCDHRAGTHDTPKPRTMLSKDPSAQVASRQRKSPYPMVSVRDALRTILDHTFVKARQAIEVKNVEIGHVIGESLVARRDIPLGPTTNVDGYAVRSNDQPGIYKVITTFPSEGLQSGAVYRINTGAPLPQGADSVIMVEDTEVISRGDKDEEIEVELLAQVERGENVRRPGSDVKSGETVLEQGDVVSAVGGELGTLAFVNAPSVVVHRRPVVAVLSTGNELFDVCEGPQGKHDPFTFSGVPDSNRFSLLKMLQSMNFDTVDLGIVQDTMEDTTKALKRGKEEADIIITTGGTSMGVSDLIKPCIETRLNGTIRIGRVAMKPGKPTTFATLPAHPMDPEPNPKLLFALPGNPASALVTFFVFVMPALRKMEGRRPEAWELPRINVQIAEDIALDPRPEYHRVVLRPGKSGLVAHSTGGQRSSRTVSLANANGLLELPAASDSRNVIPAGSLVPCVVIGSL